MSGALPSAAYSPSKKLKNILTRVFRAKCYSIGMKTETNIMKQASHFDTANSTQNQWGQTPLIYKQL